MLTKIASFFSSAITKVTPIVQVVVPDLATIIGWAPFFFGLLIGYHFHTLIGILLSVIHFFT